MLAAINRVVTLDDNIFYSVGLQHRVWRLGCEAELSKFIRATAE